MSINILVTEDESIVRKDIERSLIGRDGVRVERLPEAGWSSLLRPALLKVIVVEPQALSVAGLYRYIRFMRRSGQDAGQKRDLAKRAFVIAPLLV